MTIKPRVEASLMPQISKTARGYPIRGTSLLASLGVHGTLIGLLWILPSGESKRPIYDELIRPKEHNITYYDFRKPLPDVTPSKPKVRSPQPRGSEVSKQTIIATSPKAKSEKQLIFTPAPKLELPQDLPAQDLVMKAASSILALPAPPKEPPKQLKSFQPPPRAVQEPKLTPQAALPPPPIISASAGARVPIRTGPVVLAPPPLPQPPSLDGTNDVNIAVANLDIIAKSLPAIPDGARPAQFSKAPTKGPEASGDADDSSLKVPDLTIRRDKTAPAKAPAEPPAMRTILYSDRVRGIPLTGLSVPLRPANRTIPAAIDARFRGRNVYTTVIPIEHLPTYSGDWIVWFAEQEAKPGETPLMRAPVPFKKVEPVRDPPPANQATRRVQVAAKLDKSGKLNGVSVVTAAIPGLAEAVIEDVTSWEFKPATRNGLAVDVEVVIEIPFNFLPLPTNSTQP
jgi:hypothetical protein